MFINIDIIVINGHIKQNINTFICSYDILYFLPLYNSQFTHRLKYVCFNGSISYLFQ